VSNLNSLPRRVVITGMGAITPLGNNVRDYWEGLLAGRSGIGKITHFDACDLKCQIAGQVKDFDPHDYLSRKEAKRMERFSQFGVCASLQAVADAGLEINDLNATEIGVIIGTGVGGLREMEQQQTVYLNRGPNRCSPFMVPMMIANMAAGLTAIHTGAKGLCTCPVTACSSGANAIGDAFRAIRYGELEAVICGGAEAAITPMSVLGFTRAGAISERNSDPLRASRPFDRDRDGFVLGEGAGILILESLDRARQRRARIYAEIVGYGMTGDAYSLVAPRPDGQQAARAFQLAFEDAKIAPEAVSYINAHGTGTKMNDVMETAAIKKALGDRAYQVPVSSTKSMTGHLLGGSGGIEAVASVLAIARNGIPPTMNLDHPDPECDLDYVPQRARQQPIEAVLSNSFGFGGHNVSLILRKYAP